VSDRPFLLHITVNFLHHSLSDYDREMEAIFGRVGVRDGYRKISEKVYVAIGRCYPKLAAECQRQLNWKFGGRSAA